MKGVTPYFFNPVAHKMLELASHSVHVKVHPTPSVGVCAQYSLGLWKNRSGIHGNVSECARASPHVGVCGGGYEAAQSSPLILSVL